LVTSQAPTSRVSPADVAAPARALADALGASGQALLDYERAASAGLAARTLDEARTKAQDLAIKANGNAEAFQKSWEFYARSVLKSAPGSSKAMLEQQLVNLGGGVFRDLIGETYRRDTASAKEAIGTELARIENDLLSMAGRGETGTADYTATRERYRFLTDELTGNPAFGESVETAVYKQDRLESELLRESVRHKVETLFRDNPDAALRYATTTLNDPAIEMSAEERRSAIADAMSFHTKLSAETRIARDAFRVEARDIERTLIDTDAFVAPADIAALIDQGRTLNDPAYVRRIADAVRLRDLRTGFAAMPAGQDKLGVYQATTEPPDTIDAPPEFQPMFAAAAEKHGVPASLLAAQARQESGFDPTAVSPAGAAGISQFMSGTAARFGIDPTDPAQSIDGQARYMKLLLDRYDGDFGLALAGYNWGEGNVDKWLARGGDPAELPRETRDYIAAIAGQAPSRQYDPAVITAYRKELGTDLTGLIADANDVLARGWGLDIDTADLLVGYARAVNDQDKTRSVEEILTESALHAGVNDMSAAERMALTNELLSPDGPIGDDAVRARLVEADRANAAHRRQLLGDAPLRYGVERGWFDADQPLDFANLDAVAENLVARAAKLRIVGEHEGPIGRSALYPEEAEILTRWWSGATPDDRVQLAAAFAGSLDVDTLGATLAPLADKAEIEPLVTAAGLFAANPEAAAGVVNGQAALAANPKLAPAVNDRWRDDIAPSLPIGALAPPLGDARQRLFAAARNRYADLSLKAGEESGTFDPARWDRAMAEVTGGMVEMNRKQTIAPVYGMTQADFDRMLWRMPDAAFAGARTADGSPVSVADFRAQGHLSMVESGRYAVEIGGGFLVDADGMLFVLDLSGLPNREGKSDQPSPAEIAAERDRRLTEQRRAIERLDR
jgi:soluble lytic murein transglycosylase-like protein